MKKMLVIGVALTALLAMSACTRTQQAATVGAVGGGIIGGVTTGTPTGALVGAAVGGVAGAVVGQVAGEPENCYFRAADGRLYVDRCPQG